MNATNRLLIGLMDAAEATLATVLESAENGIDRGELPAIQVGLDHVRAMADRLEAIVVAAANESAPQGGSAA